MLCHHHIMLEVILLIAAVKCVVFMFLYIETKSVSVNRFIDFF